MVNIYIESSLKDLKRQSGAVCLIFENAENTEQTVTKFGVIIEKTKFEAEVITLKNAIYMVKPNAEVTIWTDCQYMAAAFEQKWIEKWMKNGWKTAKGQSVKHSELWQEILRTLNGRHPAFKVREPHTYKPWMVAETRKKAEKLKLKPKTDNFGYKEQSDGKEK